MELNSLDIKQTFGLKQLEKNDFKYGKVKSMNEKGIILKEEADEEELPSKEEENPQDEFEFRLQDGTLGHDSGWFERHPSTILFAIGAVLVLLVFEAVIANSCLQDCNQNRKCDNQGICVCFPFYEGAPDCTTRWIHNKTFYILFTLYTVMELLFQLVIVITAIRQLIMLRGNLFEKGNLHITFVMIVGLVAGIIRIIGYGVDPHSTRGVFPRLLSAIFLEAPVILWLITYITLFLRWVHTANSLGVSSLRKVKPVSIIMFVFVVVILPPLLIWYATVNNKLSYGIFNGFFLVVFASLVLLSTFYSYKLLYRLKRMIAESAMNLDNPTTDIRKLIYLKKLTIYVLVLNIAITIEILMMVIMNDRASSSKWEFLILNTLLRIGEFTLVIGTMRFFSRRRKIIISS